MPAEGRLHLTFTPPASPEALAAFKVAVHEADYDAPTDHIDEHGVTRSRWSEPSEHGEHTYYRSPMIEGDDIARFLTAHGISGQGWLRERRYHDRPIVPHEDERFTFGTVPETVQTVQAAALALEPGEYALLRLLLPERLP